MKFPLMKKKDKLAVPAAEGMAVINSGVVDNRKKRWMIIIFILLGVLLLFGAAWTIYNNSNKLEQPSQLDTGGLLPDEFVTVEKQNTKESNAPINEKLSRRIQAANYYSNTYQFDKVLSELDLVKQDFPDAEQNHFYLLSYFTALLQLDRKEEMKQYAKKIVALEKSGIRAETEPPSELRKAIDENAQ